MISYIKGPLTAIEEDVIVVEAGGVGMGIHVPLSVLDRLPGIGREVTVYTYFQVREDAMSLYGFLNRQDRDMFRQLIGVNGVGKTTSVGKLAGQLKDQGRKVILAAADTFRAAAIEQLTEWSNRAGVEIIAQQEGSDPAAVIYDAVAAAKSRHADVLICDTAGRLHNKKNLMEELRKINRIIEKEYPDAYRETLLFHPAPPGVRGGHPEIAFQ